jgi:hypothetical protein
MTLSFADTLVILATDPIRTVVKRMDRDLLPKMPFVAPECEGFFKATQFALLGALG